MATAMRHGAGAECRPRPQGATGHGPAALDRVVAVRLGVDDVVDEVGARCDQAEDEERPDDTQCGVPVTEHARRGRRHEHQQVLDPLLGAHPTGDQPGVEYFHPR